MGRRTHRIGGGQAIDPSFDPITSIRALQFMAMEH